jgi:hypothetical protein
LKNPLAYLPDPERSREVLYVRCQWCEIRFGKRLARLFEQKLAA